MKLILLSLFVVSCASTPTPDTGTPTKPSYGPCVLMTEEMEDRACKVGDYYNEGAMKCSSTAALCSTKVPD